MSDGDERPDDYPIDPLSKRIRETRVIVGRVKQQVATRLRDDLYVDPAKVTSLVKAETQLANLEMFERLREATRG